MKKHHALPPGYRMQALAAEDGDAFLALEVRSFALYPITIRQFRYYITKAHATCYGIFAGEKLVAHCIIELHAGRRQAYLATLAVDASHTGKGLGSYLMELWLVAARNQRYRTAASHVYTGNTASLRLHTKNGFEPVARIRDYYGRGKHAFHLRRNL